MKIARTTLLTAALLSATAMIAAPAAGAKAKKKPPKADLALQRITLGPKFVVVKPNGKTTTAISVTLSVRNVGTAIAPASTTVVKLIQGTHPVATDEIPLGRLRPGHASTQITIFRDAEPGLGMLHASAKADRTNQVSGPLENDIRATPDIPVIAQRWTGVLTADVHSPGLLGPTEDIHTTTPLGFLFTFTGLDSLNRFAYNVGGKVEERATFSGDGCTGEGDGQASMTKCGGDSGLLISRNLKLYKAVVRASEGSPFTVTVTCPNVPTPAPTTVKLEDLLTETGPSGAPVSMDPTDRTLRNHGTLGSFITLTYTWGLVADVP